MPFMSRKRSLQKKTVIKSGLIGGAIYALIIAGLDCVDQEIFDIWKFLFNLCTMGITLGFIKYYSLKKHAEKEK